MTRPTSPLRASLLIAAGFAIAACIVQQPGPSQSGLPSNQYDDRRDGASADDALLPGDYSCRMASGGYEYPPFRCVVSMAESGDLMLDKLGGSQRIRGTVTRHEGGFRFAGQFYCPYGACDSPTSGNFVAIGGHQFRGTVTSQGGSTTIMLMHLPGGWTYGGTGYGGGTYGGVSYVATPPAPAP